MFTRSRGIELYRFFRLWYITKFDIGHEKFWKFT